MFSLTGENKSVYLGGAMVDVGFGNAMGVGTGKSMALSFVGDCGISLVALGGDMFIVGVGNVIGSGTSISCLITILGFGLGSLAGYTTLFSVFRFLARSSFALVRAIPTRSNIIITFLSANPTYNICPIFKTGR